MQRCDQFKCFVEGCDEYAEDTTVYITHIKAHNLSKPLKLRCTYQDCTQKMSNLYKFHRHIITHVRSVDTHSNTEINYNRSVDNIAKHKRTTPLANSIEESTDCEPSTGGRDQSYICESLLAIDRLAVNFSLDLHRKRNLTRKDVVDIQNAVTTINSYLQNIIKTSTPLFASVDPDQTFLYETFVNKISTLFDFIGTEHKLFRYLEQADLFKIPKVYTIHNNKINLAVDLELESLGNQSHLVLMDLEFQIRKYFENGQVYEKTIRNMRLLTTSVKNSNFINGSVYRKVQEKDPGRLLIPLFLYGDEFEVNDPLSSHNKRHSLFAMYYSFPTIPERYAAKLSNIFVAGVIRKIDFSGHDIDMFMIYIIDKMKAIEQNGILITTGNTNVKVHFALMLIQGDNLGIHQMLKFSGSFSANFYCRFCKRSKDQLSKDLIEYETYLRNKDNYHTDVQLKQSDSGLTGYSLFNTLPSYSVVENLYCDSMHDLYSSGVCMYGFTEIISYIVHERKFCTISQMNMRRKELNNFKFEEGLSRMPDLEDNRRIKSITLRMTASEMAAFSNFFSFICGPFVPLQDPVWHYTTTLMKLIDTINLPAFSEKDLELLNCLVSEHHRLYQHLFKKSLKPKHHFLNHYASVIRSSGPIKKMCCIRHEARHRDFKEYFNVTSSRKNVCLTMCIKASLFFSYDVINETFLQTKTDGKFVESVWCTKPYATTNLLSTIEIDANELVLSCDSLTC
ncbi:uncharacterized protein LOC131694748 [Topomyia yanbarensis]|uniref:uncharacterized protein LOC131694748 n=1 Tax=Topomyia yanbarensis TaxID=2498891 RepID=UPI00273BAD6C|nr:uncharacterized protein LOC131694748 [Topomyia yanbarensis]